MKVLDIILLISVLIILNNCTSKDCSDDDIKSKVTKYRSMANNLDPEALLIIDSLINYCDYRTAEIYNDKASLLYDLDKWNSASIAYTEAFNLGYDKETIYYNRSISYANSDKADLAWDDYNNFKKMHPNELYLLMDLRYVIFAGLHENKNAIMVLDTMLTIKPNDMLTYSNMARLKLGLNDTIGYCEALKKAVELGLAKKYNLSEEKLLQLCN